ncbi:MAG: Crp/Fnr family transcriptional regulator [Fimbriimonadales bacterium]
MIERCGLLAGLDPGTRGCLAARSFMAYAERGDMIWMAGVPAEFCSVVGIGFVRLGTSALHGKDVAVEILGPGQQFGLMPAIEGQPLPFSATAATNCWYLKIPRATLRAVYEDCEEFKDRMIRSIGPCFRKTRDAYARLATGRAEQRIAAVLYILSDAYGCEGAEGIELCVPLTRQDIADLARTTAESTIRALNRWEEDRVVVASRQSVTILGPDALAEMLR